MFEITMTDIASLKVFGTVYELLKVMRCCFFRKLTLFENLCEELASGDKIRCRVYSGL